MTRDKHGRHYRTRPDAIASLEHDIRWWRRPKQTMAGLVAVAGMVGFIVSALLLRLGVVSMPLRYAVGLGVGYLALAFGLWRWVAAHPREAISALAADPEGSQSNPLNDVDYSDGLDLLSTDVAELEGIFLVVVLVVLFGVVFWLISAAPTMMAELTLDSLVAARVYQRLRRRDHRSYSLTFWRLTRGPLLLTAVMLLGAAWLLQHIFPDARTLGDVFHLMASASPATSQP